MVNATVARCAAVLVLASVVLPGAAWLRSAEYDEQYTLFLTAGVVRPVWPDRAFPAERVAALQAGGPAGLADIARDLRATDVHPPLYFWAAALWRRAVGTSLFAARLLPVLCSLVALAAVGGIAARAGIPPALAMLLTLGCYGFAYTGVVARGFALAQALSLGGVLVLLHGGRGRAGNFAGGLLLGAATATNYLAAFVGIAVLAQRGWSMRARWEAPARHPPSWRAQARHPRLFSLHAAEGVDGGPAPAMTVDGRPAPATTGFIGFALWLPLDLWFFLAQRGSRAGQFPPFHLAAALERLATYAAANLFGGLPLYVAGPARPLLGAALGALLLGLAGLLVRRWQTIGHPQARRVLAAAVLAPAAGLLLLGLMFDSTPIELRYLAFAVPFAALLLAGTLASLPRHNGILLAAIVLGIQVVALAGLLTRPETIQPARATARAAARLAGGGLVLLPRGNDGVGIVGAFAIEAPPNLMLLPIDATETPAQIRRRTAGRARVVLALLAQDAAGGSTGLHMLAAFTGRCWRRTETGFNVAAFERVCDRD